MLQCARAENLRYALAAYHLQLHPHQPAPARAHPNASSTDRDPHTFIIKMHLHRQCVSLAAHHLHLHPRRPAPARAHPNAPGSFEGLLQGTASFYNAGLGVHAVGSSKVGVPYFDVASALRPCLEKVCAGHRQGACCCCNMLLWRMCPF